MDAFNSLTLFFGFLLCMGSSVATTLFVLRTRSGQSAAIPIDDTGDLQFLFDGDVLLDASPEANEFLSLAEKHASDRHSLTRALAEKFPMIESVTLSQDTEQTRHITAADPDDPSHVDITTWNGFIRYAVSLKSPRDDPDQQILCHVQREIDMLRDMLNTAPLPIWRQTSNGEVIWANAKYLEMAQDSRSGDSDTQSWPPRRVFPAISLDQGAPEGLASRQKLSTSTEEKPFWYDCRSYTKDAGSYHYAFDASPIVEAEESLREFIQTLGKTFAHLPIGLAIFDRNRRLNLFNPALIDLTGLPVDFLSARPSLSAVFDQLREARILPEPKNYSDWRQRLTRAETESAESLYEETWSLPSGRSYRLTGRPHPDNAVAFLLEDISSEVSLTRHFREEVELSQSVLDSFDSAIAVFSSGGRLTLTNRAFVDLWHGGGGDSPLEEYNVIDATRHWRALSHPSPVWGDLRDFVTAGQERSDWTSHIHLLDGRALSCQIVHLPGNATLVRFSVAGPMPRFSTNRSIAAHA